MSFNVDITTALSKAFADVPGLDEETVLNDLKDSSGLDDISDDFELEVDEAALSVVFDNMFAI